MVRAEGQEQELADELSESLEWHTGTMKIQAEVLSTSNDYLPKMTLASY